MHINSNWWFSSITSGIVSRYMLINVYSSKLPPRDLGFLLLVTKLEGCPHCCCSVVAMDPSSPHCCCSVVAMDPSSLRCCCSVVAMDPSSLHCCCFVVAMDPSFPRCSWLAPPKRPRFLQRCTALVQNRILIRVALGAGPVQDAGAVGVAAVVVGVGWAVTEVLVFPVEAVVEVADH